MTTPDWEPLLRGWSRDVLGRLDDEELYEELDDVPPTARAAGWLGAPGASEAEVAALEARLGSTLPDSYRSFLRTTDGWWQPAHTIPLLYAARDVDWFATRSPEALAAWTDDAAERPTVSDAAYARYGPDQDPAQLRVRYLASCLEVGGTSDGDYLLLNPEVTTPDGEWECFVLASWLPGAHRHRSFLEAMRSLHSDFLEDYPEGEADEPGAG
jgi:hypothetical protein